MEIDKFIDGLKRDKARGNLAPHQIILLITLFDGFKEDDSGIFDIANLNREFKENWKAHQSKFETKNNKIGLPLKAFINKGYIKIETSDVINDFRNNSELESKISMLKIDNILIDIFRKMNSNSSLIERITI